MVEKIGIRKTFEKLEQAQVVAWIAKELQYWHKFRKEQARKKLYKNFS